jgi:hypothetical protein
MREQANALAQAVAVFKLQGAEQSRHMAQGPATLRLS